MTFKCGDSHTNDTVQMTHTNDTMPSPVEKIVNCHNSNTFTCGRHGVYISKSQNMHACMQIILVDS